ncbi:polysaccharide pyruvyl transferase family protein [Azotobacter chroococcum]|uniref:Polysaccharide pyruvyl transferase family protein n=1 Tax=Azotobacter chroococcum TaxID=353 RepID=A0AAP9YG61_9GAMM|nr:polysaccharide pyruvyl transferase family protein [Azotobacter chroococcum]QQE90048.1 polysaccharide pyruvyl transferase family protein [Azotobacter chroococcum]
MPKIFTLGLNESIDDSANLGTKELYNLVGQNTGNLAFHYAINRLIDFVPCSTPWGSQTEKINIMGDIGIIPCANQLGSHVDMKGLAQNLKGVKANLVAIGLGAQGAVGLDGIPEIPLGTLEWLDQVVTHAASDKPNITVRGDFTLKVLEHYGFGGKALSLGCPSLLINKSKDLGERLEQRYKGPYRKVAIAAGHPNWTSMSALEASLVRLMMDTQGTYIVQNTDESVALSRNDFAYVDAKYKEKLRNYLKLNLDDRQFDDWIRQYMISFYDIPAWMEYLRRFDFIVGSRIHGVMLAIQAGVPGLCIAHDSRIREICEKCQIPFVMAHQLKEGVTLKDIRDLVKFDGKAFDRNREAIAAQYQEFFSNNGLM